MPSTLKRLLALGLGLGLVAGAPLALAQKRAAAGPLEGTVEKVVDGDSLWFSAAGSGQRLEVRLLDIDAPEGCQDGGPQARQALMELVSGKPVLLRAGAKDQHGRTLGRLEVEGQDVSRRMVLEGQAWSTRTRWDRGPLVAEERTAVALKRGLHAAGNAEEPRMFRARNGPCGVPAASAPAPSRSSAAAMRAREALDRAGAQPGLSEAQIAPRRCDGRKRCSQMSSCEEATWFLKHCPGTELDGDRNGIPCERQLCN